MAAAVKTLLSIAGTSPTSGAGVGADVQVFRDFGYHGLWVPTTLIDQDTTAIRDARPVQPKWMRGAISTALVAGRPEAIKLGVLHNPDLCLAVAESLPQGCPVVLDPVLASGWGTPLHQRALGAAIVAHLMPTVTLITPNVPEAEALTGRAITDLTTAQDAAKALIALGAKAVLLKGGHLPGAPGDVLATEYGCEVLANEVPFVADVHGTGCHLSSALAALLAAGGTLRGACLGARRYLIACVSVARNLPGGGRPVVVHGTATAKAGRAALRGLV